MGMNDYVGSGTPKLLSLPPKAAEARVSTCGRSDLPVGEFGPPADSTLWTLEDVAYHTRLSVKTLRRMLSSGRFGPRPIVIGGRAQRFLRQEVIEGLQAGCPRRADWEVERSSHEGGPTRGRTKTRIGGHLT